MAFVPNEKWWAKHRAGGAVSNTPNVLVLERDIKGAKRLLDAIGQRAAALEARAEQAERELAAAIDACNMEHPEIGSLRVGLARLRVVVREALALVNQHGHIPELPDPECPSCGVGLILRRALAAEQEEP